jgi:DNA-directed RNA polymerase subunit RPC12/RpoP
MLSGGRGMNKIKYNLQKFMYGRNGNDEMNKALLISALVLYMLSLINVFKILYFAATVLTVYALYRAFSKDLYNRRKENQKFQSYYNFKKMQFDQRKTHKLFKCKKCSKIVRVPKGKGKIEVTCPSCGNKVIIRS